MAELADAMVLGAIGRPCRFEPCHPQVQQIAVMYGLPDIAAVFDYKIHTFYDNSLGIVKLFAIMIRIRSRGAEEREDDHGY